MKQWYAVYTKPRNESLACDQLRRQEFEVYLPRYQKQRRHARRRDIVPAPLFPRYLFVALDLQQDGWRVIRSTRGVIELVQSGNGPIPVPSKILDDIRAREDTEGFVVLAKHLKFVRGLPIKIDGGPLAGCDAIFEAQRDEDRIIALMTLLGRKVLVQVPIESVAPTS